MKTVRILFAIYFLATSQSCTMSGKITDLSSTVSLTKINTNQKTIQNVIYYELTLPESTPGVTSANFQTSNLTVLEVTGGPTSYTIKTQVNNPGSSFSIEFNFSGSKNYTSGVITGTHDLSVAKEFYTDSLISHATTDSKGNIFIVGMFSGVTQSITHYGNKMTLNSNGTFQSLELLSEQKTNYYNWDKYADGRYFRYSSAGVLNRYFSDDTLDSSFSTLTLLYGASSTMVNINALRIQSDGKILVAGKFNSYNGNSCKPILRLNSDGSIDGTWVSTGPTFTSDVINDLALQSDSKILITGDFSGFNGSTQARYFTRLNTDGSTDTAFNNNIYAGGLRTNLPNSININRVIVKPNGKILLTGNFSAFYNGDPISYLAQLSSTGIRDATFESNLGTGLSGYADHMGALSNNQVLLKNNSKITYNGTSTSSCLIRINDDGTLDTTFSPSSANTCDFGTADTFVIQSDGDIEIYSYNSYRVYSPSTQYKNIVKLNSQADVDTSFTGGDNFSSSASDLRIMIDKNDDLFVAGTFWTYGGVATQGIVKLKNNGTRDNSFTVSPGFTGGYPRRISLLKSGKIFLTGAFTTYNGQNSRRLAVLNEDGSLNTDANFSTGFSAGTVYHTLLKDGKILIHPSSAGTYNGSSYKRVFKISETGAVDPSFDIGTDANGAVYNACEDSQGRIILLGMFTQFGGQPYRYIVRVLANGSLDTSFNVGTGINTNAAASVLNCRVESDNTIVITGAPTSYNGVTVKNIFRIDSNGKLLEGFLADSTSPTGIFDLSDVTFSYIFGAIALPNYYFVYGGYGTGSGGSDVRYRNGKKTNGVFLNPF